MVKTGLCCRGADHGGSGVQVLGLGQGGVHPLALGRLGRSCHIQGHIGHGQAGSQGFGVGGVQQGADAVFVGGGVGGFQGRGLLVGHQDLQSLQRGIAQGVGQGVVYAALLDAHVDDVRRVSRQSQVTACLYDQQRDHSQAGGPMFAQVAENIEHETFLLTNQIS